METQRAWATGMSLLVCLALTSAAALKEVEHSKTFWSPSFELGSGDVVDSFKLLEFPTGHIGLRNFFAEVVDEEGNPVPLFEVYLHHWLVFKFYVKKGYTQLASSVPRSVHNLDSLTGHYDVCHRRLTERMAFQSGADPILPGGDVGQEEQELYGTCQSNTYAQAFGRGSETRRLNTTVPAPYVIATGDPESIPEGYEEAWYLNVHAIDTRGAVDATSCLECLCESYGVTVDSLGRPLKEGYRGGLHCCYDNTHCAVKDGFELPKRKLFLRYVVTWVDWQEGLRPVRLYTIDATDPRTSLAQKPNCKIEYEVPQCSKDTPSSECIHRIHSISALPLGGDLIYAYLHQHAAGLGGVLYDKDGLVLCSSDPIYGQGNTPGDEAGYIVGMTSCYPEIGSGYVETMKELRVDAYYSNEEAHTGVMSLFFILVADPVPLIKEIVTE